MHFRKMPGHVKITVKQVNCPLAASHLFHLAFCFVQVVFDSNDYDIHTFRLRDNLKCYTQAKNQKLSSPIVLFGHALHLVLLCFWSFNRFIYHDVRKKGLVVILVLISSNIYEKNGLVVILVLIFF